MGGISSAAAKGNGYSANRKKFNGIEETRDLDLNQYDAFFRTLDPQIGKFLQVDPKIESAEPWSPFSAMLDNPIRYIDPLGDSTIPGGGFWRNLWEGLKDGGSQTADFVKSLGTVQGLKNLGNGLLDLADRANTVSPTGMMKNIKTGEGVVDYVSNVPNMNKDQIGHDLGFGIEKIAEIVVATKGVGMAKNAIKTAQTTELGNTMGVLREASQGVGDFSLGEATAKISNKIGKIFAGEGATIASDGKTLVSADKLKQYRPPSVKSSKYATTGVQSNFQSRATTSTGFTSNGHLNITKPPWQFW